MVAISKFYGATKIGCNNRELASEKKTRSKMKKIANWIITKICETKKLIFKIKKGLFSPLYSGKSYHLKVILSGWNNISE